MQKIKPFICSLFVVFFLACQNTGKEGSASENAGEDLAEVNNAGGDSFWEDFDFSDLDAVKNPDIGEQPLEGISNTIQDESEVPNDNFFNIFGLGIHRTVFFPDDSRNIEIAGYLGKYYGLYSTHSTTSEVVDYLGDTKKYNSSVNNSKSLLKVGLDGEKFLANNAMDDIRYASLRNSFTLDQINRMRTVMEWSPVRKAWKTN